MEDDKTLYNLYIREFVLWMVWELETISLQDRRLYEDRRNILLGITEDDLRWIGIEEELIREFRGVEIGIDSKKE